MAAIFVRGVVRPDYHYSHDGELVMDSFTSTFLVVFLIQHVGEEAIRRLRRERGQAA